MPLRAMWGSPVTNGIIHKLLENYMHVENISESLLLTYIIDNQSRLCYSHNHARTYKLLKI